MSARFVYLLGFPSWRVYNLEPLASLRASRVQVVRSLAKLKEERLQAGDEVWIWGAAEPPGLSDHVRSCRARLLHVEDGFVRSVGLGSDLIRPMSLVLDELGLYFDAQHPSDLEQMLATRVFDPQDIERARSVREFIVRNCITKYNLESREPVVWTRRAGHRGHTVVLVPGQVEDDASIQLGGTPWKSNLALLQAARLARPGAFIVYKPHPDVASGNRAGRLALAQALAWADHVETHAGVVSCIEACDEVHTLTSLCGFDALLRGKPVITYGQPFYAGWGLTEDRAPDRTALDRRQRRLRLDELVAGALLHYPLYWDWELRGCTTCEAVLHRIVDQRATLERDGALERLRSGWLRRQWRKVATLIRALVRVS